MLGHIPLSGEPSKEQALAQDRASVPPIGLQVVSSSAISRFFIRNANPEQMKRGSAKRHGAAPFRVEIGGRAIGVLITDECHETVR
jgi:hypothetical protein